MHVSSAEWLERNIIRVTVLFVFSYICCGHRRSRCRAASAMPSTLKIRVRSARGLPVMDKSAKTTDAYVEVRLGGHVYAKTGVAKKTLNPEWNIDMRINCTDDSVVQNEPLEFRLVSTGTTLLKRLGRRRLNPATCTTSDHAPAPRALKDLMRSSLSPLTCCHPTWICDKRLICTQPVSVSPQQSCRHCR